MVHCQRFYYINRKQTATSMVPVCNDVIVCLSTYLTVCFPTRRLIAPQRHTLGLSCLALGITGWAQDVLKVYLPSNGGGEKDRGAHTGNDKVSVREMVGNGKCVRRMPWLYLSNWC